MIYVLLIFLLNQISAETKQIKGSSSFQVGSNSLLKLSLPAMKWAMESML